MVFIHCCLGKNGLNITKRLHFKFKIRYMNQTTTLKKLISEIDFNNKYVEDSPDWETLSSIFNIYDLSWREDTRLKCYFIKKWYCTDSYVGIRAYFLDNEFIAISNQTGRKMDEEFSFVSKEVGLKLKTYLESLVEDQDSNLDIIDEDFLNAEIPLTYKIEYNSQILHKQGFLNSEKVEIIKTRYSWEEKDKYFHTVEIKLTNGKKQEIDCRELDFEYNK